LIYIRVNTFFCIDFWVCFCHLQMWLPFYFIWILFFLFGIVTRATVSWPAVRLGMPQTVEPLCIYFLFYLFLSRFLCSSLSHLLLVLSPWPHFGPWFADTYTTCWPICLLSANLAHYHESTAIRVQKKHFLCHNEA